MLFQIFKLNQYEYYNCEFRKSNTAGNKQIFVDSRCFINYILDIWMVLLHRPAGLDRRESVGGDLLVDIIFFKKMAPVQRP